MSWYGNYNQSSKQLDSLLDTRPSLASLLLYPQFTQLLKSFNPKLLDYITNSSSIPQQLVTYISVPPLDTDTTDRKYKLPLLSIQAIETETICIINSLLKNNQDGIPYFLVMFDLLKKNPILPLLTGYFNRVCFTMCRTRYKQVLEAVYTSPAYLELLINSADSEGIANCLPLFLCVQLSKNIVLSQDKTAIKMGIVRTILNRIEAERTISNPRTISIVQNLCFVIREIIEKYYLISHGKQMLQIILQQKNVETILALVGQQSQMSFPAMSLTLSFLKYYSLSAFNTEQVNEELGRKNMQRLETQPFVRILNSSFRGLLQKVKRSKNISLYNYALLEVLCHCITLSSNKVLQTLKESQFFQTIIDLLFKHENCNILHKLVERTFLHIFTTERNIYEKYKEHLFCEVSVIDLTAKRLLELFPEADALEKAKQKGYFGILMKIIKIYSSISTTNAQIREAITSKSEVWNKVTKKIIKPYEASCSKQIGQLQNVPDTAPVQFSVKKNQNQFMPRLIQNTEAVEQIKRQEETMPKTLELSEMKKQGQTLADTKIDDQSFFKSPLEDLAKKKTSNDQTNLIANRIEENDGKRPNFNQFLNKRKVQVGEEIKLQRNLSGQKRLSADKKTRLTSPSPSKKRNSWKEDEQGTKDQKQTKTPAPAAPISRQNLPKIPAPHPLKLGGSSSSTNLTKSALGSQLKKTIQQQKLTMSLSMANLESLRKTTITRTMEQPTERKYRKVRSKDKALLAYLGIGL